MGQRRFGPGLTRSGTAMASSITEDWPLTLRVDTPCTYISARDATSAWDANSVRTTRLRTWRSEGTTSFSLPTRVTSAQGSTPPYAVNG